MDNSRRLCVFNKCSNTCLGAVEEHFVCARAEREERRQVVRNERLERTSKRGSGCGEKVGCSS